MGFSFVRVDSAGMVYDVFCFVRFEGLEGGVVHFTFGVLGKGSVSHPENHNLELPSPSTLQGPSTVYFLG